MSFWNYNVNFNSYQLPLPNLPVIESNVRYFVAHHARGVFMRAAGDTVGASISDSHNYVISGLLWDPNRSGDALPNPGGTGPDIMTGRAKLAGRENHLPLEPPRLHFCSHCLALARK